MPSRKQRRRRQKERRHEYEYVYVDDEGQEVTAEDADVEAVPPARDKTAKTGARTLPATGRRPVPPPSWRRVLKRGLIFAPFMYLTLTFLGGDMPVETRVIQTAWLLVMFVPFSYLLDRAMYRRFARQSEGSSAPAARRR